jgi:hypothetical protein
MSPPADEKAAPESLLKAYAEICNSYRAIDDFRMKLLGFLPFASVAGVLLLSKDIPSGQTKLVGYACFFASVFTLSLFLYEIRGMLRSGGLIRQGKRIEEHLLVHGQFFQCEAETHPRSNSLVDKVRLHMNTTVASCFMYSLVFAFWVFLALRFAFDIKVPGCTLSAAGAGLVIGGVAYFLVRSEVPA